MIERAVVRWVTNDQFGVSFLELSSDAGTRLSQVFQILHKEQHAAAPVIPVAACFMATKEENAALPSPEVRVGRFYTV
jgi:hypothetical protein